MATADEIKKLNEKVGDRQFHHVECDAYAEMKIELSKRGKRHPEMFDAVAISSKNTIAEGLKACVASPLKTVFVVRIETGEVLYALSQNDEYVVYARKKKPKPPSPPPPPPKSMCCQLCAYKGGTSCSDFF